MTAPITFLSDYGLEDEFVGVVHSVIARLAPDARVIDVGHGVARQDVLAGALMLRRAMPFLPVGVHLAVVDPEVGARRRAVALRTADDQLLVGPDNGLLMPAADLLGGVSEAVEVSLSRWRLEPVSATFHGRDIFAPVAARLAAGEALADAGEELDPEGLVTLELPRPETLPEGGLVAHVVHVDVYGNVLLDAGHADLVGAGFELGGPVRICGQRAHFVRTFAEGSRGALLLYEDSSRMLAVAVTGGNAAGLLSLRAGDEVQVVPG